MREYHITQHLGRYWQASLEGQNISNALGHLENILKPVLLEMKRVTIKNGYLIFIATWKMDKRVLEELKSIVELDSTITIHSNIETKKYRALIIEKILS